MNIPQVRLFRQHITNPLAATPEALVQNLGAIQAQDYPMSKWAIGLRLQDTTEADIEAALDAGKLVRTHVLRPTWHIVAAGDARWMLALTAPHIRRSMTAMQRSLELDAKVFSKTARIIEQALRDGRHLSRAALMEVIVRSGIAVSPLRAAHIMMEAELNGIVCNGRRQGSKLSYALLDEQCLPAPKLDREDALRELALRYYRSHGPATAQDFAWWSGLPAADVRRATEAARPALETVLLNGREYLLNGAATPPDKTTTTFLLPAFDEYLVGYKDRSAALPAQHNRSVITVNGIFRPVIVRNGKVVGQWSLRQQVGGACISILPHEGEKAVPAKALAPALKRYSAFAGAAVKLC